MGQSPSDIRKAENEVVFRKANEKAIKRLADTRKVAAEEGQEVEFLGLDDVELLFYCECADDKCRERIPLTPEEYKKVRKNSSQFILLPGHHKSEIERIVIERDKYVVVEKFMTPPEKAEELNPIQSI